MKVVPISFPFLFFGMWLLITFTIAKVGWSLLAKKFILKGRLDAIRIGVISASINISNYRNSIILFYNEEGIILRTIFFFRLFHPPLFIPWDEIEDAGEVKKFFTTYERLRLGIPFITTITIEKSIFNKFKNNLLKSKSKF